MTVASSAHTHPESWPATMDWLDIRNHLVLAHGEDADEIDDLGRYSDDAARRRSHADSRHRTLHGEPPLAARPTIGSSSAG
jgi:hypothetical protein